MRSKRTLVLIDAVLFTDEDLKLFKKSLIHAARHIIINTDGDEDTETSRMGRGRLVTDVCYNNYEL